MWVTLLWENRRLIAEVACILALIGVVWWFGFHNTALIKRQETRIATLTTQVKAGEQAARLLEDIREGRETINAKTKADIIEIRKAIFTPHSTYVFMPAR